LPPAGTPAADSGAGSAVQEVSIALRKKGYRVLSPAQVSARLTGHAPDACRNAATCDLELALATLGADAVVSIAIWQRGGASTEVVVHVRRVGGFGQSEVTVSGAGLRAAAHRALLGALDDSQRTHEILVRIESEPSGATAHVDQTLSAQTPANVSLLPGNHLLSVEAPGYVTLAQYIDVPDHSDSPVLYRLQLTAANAQAHDELAAPAIAPPESSTTTLTFAEAEPLHDQPAPTARTSSVWNYVIAAALLGTAAPLIANAIYAGGTRGDCVGAIDARNRCGQRVTLGPAFYASIAVGGAALVGGVGFLVFQPVTSARSSRPDGALLQWHQPF
jgi:hypothetical protein